MYISTTLLTTLLAATQLVASVPAVAFEGETKVVVVTKEVTVTEGAGHVPTGGARHHQHHAWQGHGAHDHPHPHPAQPDPEPSKQPQATHEPTSQPKSTTDSSPPSGYGSSDGGDESRGSKAHGFNYQQAVINSHNIHRANHSAPAIKWSSSLAATAEKIANTCVYAHNTQMDGGGYGQNIAAGPPPDFVNKIITNMFYNHEEPYFHGQYGKAKPDMKNFEHWGHFSQLVWKDSTSVGCHTTNCAGRRGKLKGVGNGVHPYFTVCNYHNRGNMGGQYGEYSCVLF